jgi:uncharacterized Zn finger protein (UPF0148 family)
VGAKRQLKEKIGKRNNQDYFACPSCGSERVTVTAEQPHPKSDDTMTPRRKSEIMNWYTIAQRVKLSEANELTSDLFNALTSILDNNFGTLHWFYHENDMGRRKLKRHVRNVKTAKCIKSVEDLLWIMMHHEFALAGLAGPSC